MTGLPHNGWEFLGFLALLGLMAYQTWMQHQQGHKMNLLEHHMNAMRDAQVKGAYAQGGMDEQERSRSDIKSPLEHRVGQDPMERLEEIRGQE